MGALLGARFKQSGGAQMILELAKLRDFAERYTAAWCSQNASSARESLCRGLGSGWFTERFHTNALVTHIQHGQVFCAARRLENYAVAGCRLHQRVPQG